MPGMSQNQLVLTRLTFLSCKIHFYVIPSLPVVHILDFLKTKIKEITKVLTNLHTMWNTNQNILRYPE